MKMVRPKNVEGSDECRTVRNEELGDSYTSPSIVRDSRIKEITIDRTRSTNGVGKYCIENIGKWSQETCLEEVIWKTGEREEYRQDNLGETEFEGVSKGNRLRILPNGELWH
jgi:hypothetical protein